MSTHRVWTVFINYEMGETILSKTVKEKYLGETMNTDRKVSEKCGMAASTDNLVFGMIPRNITYKENGLIVPLHKAIFRPHLVYCSDDMNIANYSMPPASTSQLPLTLWTATPSGTF